MLSFDPPNSTRNACAAAGVSFPWNWLIRLSAGFPGMMRGIRKFRLIAAQAVTR